MTEPVNPPEKTYRLAELAETAGLTVATVKYYLREGLLPAGIPVSARLSEYTDEHLRRLRLIRALVSVRGLGVARTREVLDTLDRHVENPHLALGLAVGSVPPSFEQAGSTDDDPAAADGDSAARDLVERLGWRIHPRSTPLDRLDEVIGAFTGLFPGTDPYAELEPYARLMERVAELDLDAVDAASGSGRGVERAVVGTFLLDRALSELRRLAQENESAGRR